MIKKKAIAFITVAVSALGIAGSGIAVATIPETGNILVNRATTTGLTLTAKVGDDKLVNAATGAEVPIVFTADKFEMTGNVQKITKITFNDTVTDKFVYRPGFAVDENDTSKIFYDKAYTTTDNSAAFGGEGQYETPARIYATPAEGFHFANVKITYDCETGGKHFVKKAPTGWHMVGTGSFVDELNAGFTYSTFTGIKLDDNMSVTYDFKAGDKIAFLNPAEPSNNGYYGINNIDTVNSDWDVIDLEGDHKDIKINKDIKLTLRLDTGKLIVSNQAETVVDFVLESTNKDVKTLNTDILIKGSINDWHGEKMTYADGVYKLTKTLSKETCKIQFKACRFYDGDWRNQIGYGDDWSNFEYYVHGGKKVITIKFDFKNYNDNWDKMKGTTSIA